MVTSGRRQGPHRHAVVGAGRDAHAPDYHPLACASTMLLQFTCSMNAGRLCLHSFQTHLWEPAAGSSNVPTVFVARRGPTCCLHTQCLSCCNQGITTRACSDRGAPAAEYAHGSARTLSPRAHVADAPTPAPTPLALSLGAAILFVRTVIITIVDRQRALAGPAKDGAGLPPPALESRRQGPRNPHSRPAHSRGWLLESPERCNTAGGALSAA